MNSKTNQQDLYVSSTLAAVERMNRQQLADFAQIITVMYGDTAAKHAASMNSPETMIAACFAIANELATYDEFNPRHLSTNKLHKAIGDMERIAAEILGGAR